MYKINTKYYAGPGPARARPWACAGLGPGRAGGRLAFCIYLKYLGYILDIFGYIFGIFLGWRTGVQFV